MFENDKENDFFAGDGSFDLGSDFGSFDNPFENEDAFGEEMAVQATDSENVPIKNSGSVAEKIALKAESVQENTETKLTEVSEDEAKINSIQSVDAAKDQTDADPDKESETVPNPFDAAIAQAEEKQAESAKSGLIDKLPVFSYAKAEEEIVDTSKTFDQLRNEKAEDFPELDDGTSVTWKVVYGTVTKNVPNPKKTTIASLKKQIEGSKEFTDYLKKAKGETVCKVTPTVTAKKKGTVSPYKGVFSTVDEAVKSGKVIAFVPSSDGNVYEVRNNKIGTFIAKTDKVSILPKVRAGFIPALPKIPNKILLQLITFFKSYITEEQELEAMAYIYWSTVDSQYYVYVPKQVVSHASVDTTLPEMDEDRFSLVMEIHSHNNMKAFFSSDDDKDERATRLYAVVGRFDKLFPDIKVRMSVGGRFVELSPADVFEGMDSDYPEKWCEAVQPMKYKGKEAAL